MKVILITDNRVAMAKADAAMVCIQKAGFSSLLSLESSHFDNSLSLLPVRAN